MKVITWHLGNFIETEISVERCNNGFKLRVLVLGEFIYARNTHLKLSCKMSVVSETANNSCYTELLHSHEKVMSSNKARWRSATSLTKNLCGIQPGSDLLKSKILLKIIGLLLFHFFLFLFFCIYFSRLSKSKFSVKFLNHKFTIIVHAAFCVFTCFKKIFAYSTHDQYSFCDFLCISLQKK